MFWPKLSKEKLINFFFSLPRLLSPTLFSIIVIMQYNSGDEVIFAEQYPLDINFIGMSVDQSVFSRYLTDHSTSHCRLDYGIDWLVDDSGIRIYSLSKKLLWDIRIE